MSLMWRSLTSTQLHTTQQFERKKALVHITGQTEALWELLENLEVNKCCSGWKVTHDDSLTLTDDEADGSGRMNASNQSERE